MPQTNRKVRELVFDEISRFSKTRVYLLRDIHELRRDLNLVRPALVYLAAALRAHIQTRRPHQTLLVTELEKPKFTIGDTVKLVQDKLGESVRPWTTPGIGLVLAMVLLLPALAEAQTAKDWAWWIDQFDLRKSFDGGKSEQEPATVTYVNPNDGEEFWLVDLAIKYKGKDFAPESGPLAELLVAPSFEWHKASAEPLLQLSAANKISANLTTEIYLHDVFGGRSACPIWLAPGAFIKGSITKNELMDTTEGSASILASTFSDVNWMPGAISAVRGRPFVRYVPYVGIEYFNNLAITANKVVLAEGFTGWFRTFRLYVEMFPNLNPFAARNRLVFTGEYIYRSPVDDAIFSNSLSLTSASLTFYFDVGQTVGLSYNYESGENPKTNFVRQRRSLIAFRAKL